MSITRAEFEIARDEVDARILAYLHEHKSWAFTQEEVAGGVSFALKSVVVASAFFARLTRLQDLGEIQGKRMPNGVYYVAAMDQE